MAHPSHWVRAFKIPYRRQKDGTFIREADVQCETLKNGLHPAGERSLVLATDTRVTVQVVTPYFEPPRSEQGQAQVDALYARCEREADDLIRATYPDARVTAEA